MIGLGYYTKLERETKHLAYKGVEFNKAVSQLASEMSTVKRTYAESITEILKNCNNVEDAVDYIIDYKIKNLLQSWVHLMGNKFRKNHQSVFTNLNLFSPRILLDNFDYYIYPNGDKIHNYIGEITNIQLIFAKFFSKGIKGNRITKVVAMPVVTLMTPNDSVGGEALQKEDDEFIDAVLRYFHKYNNLNVYRGLKLAICCRISVEKPSHRVDVNSLGVVTGSNGNDAVGSLRVVSIAFPNIVNELININENFYKLSLQERFDIFKTELKEKLLIADDILETQRNIIYERNTEGLYQLSKTGWVNFKKLASTYGGVGLYEALKLISNNEYGSKYTKEELDFGNEILKIIDEKCTSASNKYKNSYNMEVSIPAESMAIRFKDRDVIKYGEENIPYKELSNQFTPLTLEVDMVEKLQNEDYLSSIVDPTGICHINIDGEINPEQNVSLHRNLWKNYPNIDHYAFNAPISTCLNGHSEPTQNDGKCIVCGANIEFTTSRSIGYFKTVEFDFGKGRRDEFKRRKFTKL